MTANAVIAMLLGATAVAGLVIPKPMNEMMGKRYDPSEVRDLAAHPDKRPLRTAFSCRTGSKVLVIRQPARGDNRCKRLVEEENRRSPSFSLTAGHGGDFA